MSHPAKTVAIVKVWPCKRGDPEETILEVSILFGQLLDGLVKGDEDWQLDEYGQDHREWIDIVLQV